MNIVWQTLDDGGFVAGDRDSEMTAYAYPSSPNAIVAKRYPKLTAEEMLSSERRDYRNIPAVQEYDRKNWLLLANASAQLPPSHPGDDTTHLPSFQNYTKPALRTAQIPDAAPEETR